MQIHYYQHHYTQYIEDAVQHFKQKRHSTDENSSIIPSVVSSASTSSSLFISYKEFYIKQLNSLDLYKDYLKWQRPNSDYSNENSYLIIYIT